MIDMQLFIKIFKIQTRLKTKCLNKCVHVSYLKSMQIRTANYRRLQSPGKPLMPGGNKKSDILKVKGLFN